MKNPELKSLSDKELLAEIQRLRRREHLSTIEILLHLHEVERRKLYLKLSYSSMFAYCEEHLKYSASAATRRIRSARCIRRFPDALGLLEKSRVNLMTLSAIASVLTDENHKVLLASICDKTQREAEAIASQYRPPISMRDRVKPVRVRVLEPKAAERPQAESARSQTADNRTSMSDYDQTGRNIMLTNSDNGKNRSSSGDLSVRTQQKLLVQFLANKEFMERYEEVRALLSQRLSDTSFEAVFEALINEFLERHSPVRRQARREARKSRRPARNELRRVKATQTKPRAKPTSQEPKRRTRQIPAAVRDRVFVRDKGRCSYVSRNGRRCGSTQALQVDHIKPFARGGKNSASNLRLLCAKHNRLAAQQVFGEDFIERFRPRE